MRRASSARTSAFSARTDSFIVTVSGMMLNVSPACTLPTVITAACCASTSRATIVCSATMMLPAADIGSRAKCGIAPWPPTPRSVIVTRSADAIAAPVRKAMSPAARPGMLWIAKIASHGKRSNRPSSIIAFAPPKFSSAGWKIRFSVPENWRVAARWRAAHSSIAVWPSWPHACILFAWRLAYGRPVVSASGSASMSARSPTVRVPLPFAQHADHTRLADAAMHFITPAGEQLGDEIARERFLERGSGMSVDAAAHFDQLGGDRGDTGDDGVHGLQHGISCGAGGRLTHI